jgi:hypothetical protein
MRALNITTLDDPFSGGRGKLLDLAGQKHGVSGAKGSFHIHSKRDIIIPSINHIDLLSPINTKEEENVFFFLHLFIIIPKPGVLSL